MQTLEGHIASEDNARHRFALLASRFNELIVKELIAGAQDALVRSGVSPAHIVLVRVPGAFELPLAAKMLAESKRADAIVALGCVIRGETSHYDHVAQAANAGLQQVAMQFSLPIGLGVLTVENLEQALARAGSKAGNKGADAALAALEMLNLGRKLQNEAKS
jgi:6,7-dimethyl-8-ribityllumazine synthase